MDKLITVHCVSQERWYIDRAHCSCGGEYRINHQSLKSIDERPADVIRATCGKCGQEKIFLFDISVFYNRPPKSGAVPDTPANELTLSPMERTLCYLKKLALSGDNMALDYITEAIASFRQQQPSVEGRGAARPSFPTFIRRSPDGSTHLEVASVVISTKEAYGLYVQGRRMFDLREIAEVTPLNGGCIVRTSRGQFHLCMMPENYAAVEGKAVILGYMKGEAISALLMSVQSKTSKSGIPKLVEKYQRATAEVELRLGSALSDTGVT